MVKSQSRSLLSKLLFSVLVSSFRKSFFFFFNPGSASPFKPSGRMQKWLIHSKSWLHKFASDSTQMWKYLGLMCLGLCDLFVISASVFFLPGLMLQITLEFVKLSVKIESCWKYIAHFSFHCLKMLNMLPQSSVKCYLIHVGGHGCRSLFKPLGQA